MHTSTSQASVLSSQVHSVPTLQEGTVLKFGSTTLLDSSFEWRTEVLEHIISQALALKERGSDVVIVSSGLMSRGRALCQRIGFDEADSSDFARAGRESFQQAWTDVCSRHAIVPYFAWMTDDTFEERAREIARQTGDMLPIVNGDDSAMKDTSERSRDNDWIAAELAIRLQAKRLILVTEAGGLLSEKASIVPLVDERTLSQLKESGALKGKSIFGTGGIESKVSHGVEAARRGTSVQICGPSDSYLVKDGVGTHLLFE